MIDQLAQKIAKQLLTVDLGKRCAKTGTRMAIMFHRKDRPLDKEINLGGRNRENMEIVIKGALVASFKPQALASQLVEQIINKAFLKEREEK